jgi:hypothetical protein
MKNMEGVYCGYLLIINKEVQLGETVPTSLIIVRIRRDDSKFLANDNPANITFLFLYFSSPGFSQGLIPITIYLLGNKKT